MSTHFSLFVPFEFDVPRYNDQVTRTRVLRTRYLCSLKSYFVYAVYFPLYIAIRITYIVAMTSR